MTMIDHEFFPTPDWAVDRLIEEVRAFRGTNEGFNPHYFWPATLVEPCLGDGAIVAGFRRNGIFTPWSGVDLVSHRIRSDGMPETLLPNNDALMCRVSPDQQVVTNPPFSLAYEILQHFLAQTPRVTLLVRETFIGSSKRNEYLRKHMPNLRIDLPRRFRGPNGRGGTGQDSAHRSWLIWDPNIAGHHYRIARY